MEGRSSLRPATADDLAAVMEVEAKVHLAPWTRDHFEAELGKPYSQTLLLTDDETDSQILGYIVFWILMDETQILNVAVDLPYRGLGYAQKLVRQVIQLALKQGAKRVILEVRKSNTPAIQLYQKVGFAITQLRRGGYSNGEDAYLMTLPLDGVEGSVPSEF